MDRSQMGATRQLQAQCLGAYRITAKSERERGALHDNFVRPPSGTGQWAGQWSGKTLAV